MRRNHSAFLPGGRAGVRLSGGFTIIELMLALVFVAFILVFMALTLVQMMRIYDKAISMRQVNQAGRTITEDISESMRAQLPEKITTDFVSSGLLCVGSTVYRWNPLFTAPLNTQLRDAARNTSAAPVNPSGAMMVRKVFSNANATCDIATADSTSASAFVAGSIAPLLTGRSRVIWASARPTTGINDRKLIELTFIIGTHDRTEVDTAIEQNRLTDGPYNSFNITPHRERTSTSASITCLPGSGGNYCAFAEFKTIIYASRNQ